MSAGLDSFLSLYSKIASERTQSIYYYPEIAIQRIREGQMAVFYDECVKDGLMRKNGAGYALSEKGLEAVASGDSGALVAPYHRAKKRINLLYIDVLI